MQYALYYYDSCPFCQRVLMAMQSLNVNVEKRNVMKNPEFRQQQIDATKRTTVPCLLINYGDHEEWMFESGDIVRYLKSVA